MFPTYPDYCRHYANQPKLFKHYKNPINIHNVNRTLVKTKILNTFENLLLKQGHL